MRIEEYLAAALAAQNSRSGAPRVVECGDTDEPGNAQTSPALTDPAKGDQ